MRLPFSAFSVILITSLAATLAAATPDRITRAIDTSRVRAIPGSVHHLTRVAQNDRGPAAADRQLDHIQLFMKPSAAQQDDLDGLLRDQQNPASPNFRQWLTPDAYAERFGLSANDHNRVIAWLKSAGLTVQESSRGRNWISFAGTTAQVSRALHTSFHNYQVNGKQHFANAADPSVPDAIADLVAGFSGLNDFPAISYSKLVGPAPDYSTAAGTHYLSPGDYATIYNIKPLYTAGFDGTGQAIAIVGESDIVLSDIRGFRTDFGLAANDPKQILYGTDPGFTGAQVEANLDLEWAGAVAPRATIYYVFGQNAFTAFSVAVSNNIAPVISISYGFCEADYGVAAWRTVAQQANAQGQTVLAASGDSGAGGCDFQGAQPVATHGAGVSFPAELPEVTAVGGTMFNEGTGNYWNPVNSLVNGTALSYIPEIAWNEGSLNFGLGATGGGASIYFPKPAWQNGPGVPADNARDLPDISLSAAANHDGYLFTYNSGTGLFVVGGTSASTPSLAGIVALLNHYQVKQGFQKTAGLGNINPQLYRLAQVTPSAFHDVTGGGNIVPCLQGSPGCATGSVGFSAGPGYDMATGLGSVDANVLATSWNTAASAAVITLTSGASKITLNDNVTVTATVTSGTGKGTPTGTVNFAAFGTPIGSVALAPVAGVPTASVSVPAYLLGKGTSSVVAQYQGDVAFSGAATSVKIQVTLPTTVNVAAIEVTGSTVVRASQSGTAAPTWQAAVTFTELAGVPAAITGFTIDGAAQTVSQYFASPNIPAGGTLNATLVLRNQAVPVSHVFGFTGTDAGGNTWSRQVTVQFLGPAVEGLINFNLWALPLTMQQNTTAPAGCPWSQQIVLDETTGYSQYIVTLLRGSVDISDQIPQIFGTTRLAPWGSVSGTVCWSNATPNTADLLLVQTTDPFGDLLTSQVNVTFTGPAPSTVQLTAAPASVSLKPSTVPIFGSPASLSVNLSDKTQPWTATVYPASPSTSWLQLSQNSGIGPATIGIRANATGFAPGSYKATIVLQSPSATPQWLAVPVIWVNTGQAQLSPAAPVITSVGNAFTGTQPASPGMLMAVYGTQLANSTLTSPKTLDNSLGGVSATVNGWPAPILYVSPTQINIQVPFEAGAGPAVVGVNNNGQIGGFMFQMAPSSPGIVSVGGTITPSATAKAGAYATMYVTGVGDVNNGQPTGLGIATGTPLASLPLPLLPLNVTVGGKPALVAFAGFTPGIVGVAQVNFVVPSTVAAGVQPVIVTVNGVASPSANITVTP